MTLVDMTDVLKSIMRIAKHAQFYKDKTFLKSLSITYNIFHGRSTF